MRCFESVAAAIAAVAVLFAASSAIAQTHVQLTSGFEPDPSSTMIDLSYRSGNPPRTTDERGVACVGGFNWVDLDIEFTASNLGLPLIISVGSNVDTTLVVQDPRDDFYCDDDGGALGRNPMLYFPTPISGRYRIFVGIYRNPDTGESVDVPYGARARIAVSELYSQ